MSTTELSLINTQQPTEHIANDTSDAPAEADVYNYQEHEHLSISKKRICCYIVIEIFIFTFISLLSILLMLIFACLSSNLSVATIPIWTLFIFLLLQSIVFGLFMICKSHRTKIKKWSIIRGTISITEYIILFLVMEILISTFVPNLSIFPNAYSYDALTKGNYTNEYKTYLNASQTFFGCNLDVSIVKIRDVTQSSMVNNYFDTVNFNAAAYVNIDTVHIVNSNHLIHDSTFIHELVHVWQFEYGLWYGADGLKRVFDQILKPPDTSNYYYGDLNKARSEGKDFFDFGTEQQAEIVEDYYIQRGNNTSLYYYATQYVLRPC